MIFSFMAKFFKTMLENKISGWLDENKIRAKGQANIMDKHSEIEWILNFMIIVENCCKNKEDHMGNRKILWWCSHGKYSKL